MAERNLAIRLSVMDGGKVKAELKEIGESGEKSLKKIELAGKPASKSLIALNAAANDVKSGAVGLSGQIGPLGSAMAALGPVGLAVGAALGVVTLGLTASIQEAAEAERSYNRLQAVLRATGHSSGLTARELSSFADEMEATTLTTAEGVMDAASVLATFRSVSGETFTRTISLAQDLSSVFGKDLNASVLALGKALENPVDGLGALKKIGVDFSPVEQQMLQDMVDVGNAAEAQRIILDKVAHSLAGTGGAEATGVTGATHQLSVAWKNMLEAIGETSVVAGAAQGSLEVLAATFRGMGSLFKDAPLGEQLSEAKAELTEAQAVLERLYNFDPKGMMNIAPLIEDQKEKISELRAEVEKLTAASQKESAAIAAEKAEALKGQQTAARASNAELVSNERRKLDEALDKLVSDPAAKIAKINAELEKTRERMEKLRARDGSDSSAIDGVIKQAEEAARLQIEAIQKPISETARKESEANQKIIDDLKRQLLGLGNERQAFIDQAVSRLSDKADAGKVGQTRDLAAKLFDQKAFSQAEKVIGDLGKQMDVLGDKRKAFIQGELAKLPETVSQEQIERTKQYAAALFERTEAQEKLDRLKQEGKQITEGARSAEESYAEQIARLTEMLNAGAISQDVFNKAKGKAYDESLAGRTDAQAGAIRAFHAYQKEAENTAGAVEEAFTAALKATEDAIVNMVTSGEISLNSLNDLANSIVADITRMVVQQSITGPLSKWMGSSMESGGFLDSVFSSIFHEGGTAGETAPSRQVPAYVFAGAPRYHGGGIAGLKPNEVPAILERGETVTPKNKRGARSSVNVVMNITTQDANSFRASQGQIAAKAARGISRAKRNM